MRILVVILLLYSSKICAQEHAWVYFKDKPSSTSYFNNPLTMLSQRALDRREKQQIALDSKDVPVESSYIDVLKKKEGITLYAQSKWLNAVHVVGETEKITLLTDLSFVEKIEYADKSNTTIATSTDKLSSVPKYNNFLKEETIEFYGNSENQNKMIGVDALHNKGFHGKGLQIAVFDAGFYGVNIIGAFSHLFDNDTLNGEILGGHNYVSNSSDIYENSSGTHGSFVLSTMAGFIKDSFVGTATEGSYYLFVTEDGDHETPLEESYWVQAAEKADSLGVDIINSSLGYSQFDEAKYDYTYQDMDGETTFITRGANIASEKGMLVVTSIGNSGNSHWKYLSAPADAKNILAVGAVNAEETIASFSSFGPSYDGRMKPETLAKGQNTAAISENNQVIQVSGTSFSSPIIAGVTACLWQAYPLKTNLEIRDLIIENSNRFLNPTEQSGYGLLDLQTISLENQENVLPFEINYQTDFIEFKFVGNIFEDINVEVYSVNGRLLYSGVITEINSEIDIQQYALGIYYLRYRYLQGTLVQSFYKQ